MFIDPDPVQLDASIKVGASCVELHTGHFADAESDEESSDREFELIRKAVVYGKKRGLKVNAGHGLHYHNVERIAVDSRYYLTSISDIQLSPGRCLPGLLMLYVK